MVEPFCKTASGFVGVGVAAITPQHRRPGRNNRIVFLTVLEDGTSKSKAPADRVPGLQTATFSARAHTAERAPSGVSLHKGTNSIKRVCVRVFQRNGSNRVCVPVCPCVPGCARVHLHVCPCACVPVCVPVCVCTETYGKKSAHTFLAAEQAQGRPRGATVWFKG